MAAEQNKNVVWSYFTESVDNPKFAACCLCDKSISQGSHIPKLKTTAPLMRHLKSVHPEAVSQEIKEETERKKRKADEAERKILEKLVFCRQNLPKVNFQY